MSQPEDIGRLTNRDVDLEEYARLLRDRGVAMPGTPSDAEVEAGVRQGAVDAASAEGTADAARLDAARNRPIALSPMGALKNAQAAAADMESATANRAKPTTVEAQTQAQTAAAINDRLSRSYDELSGRGRVVGMTRGGFQPTTRQTQGQVERTQMVPGYNSVASEEIRQRGLAGEGNVRQEIMALDLARRNSQTEGEIRRIHAWATEQANAEEDRALKGAQDKFDSIVQEFQNSGPKMRTYADLWNNASGGQKVMQVFGFILGSLGSMQKGRTNAFLDQLDKTIQRQADIEEKQSEKLGRAVGFAQNAYGVLRQRLRDRSLARDAYHLLALQAFDEKVKEKAAQLGLSSGDARLAQVRAENLERQRSIMEKLSSKVLSQESAAERYLPPQAIMAPGASLPKGAGEEAEKYEKARIEAKLPDKMAAIKGLRQALSKMSPKDEGFISNLIRRRGLLDPRGFSALAMRSDNPELMQQVGTALSVIMNSRGGKSLTETEAAHYGGSLVGDGSIAALKRGADLAEQDVNETEAALHAAYPMGYEIGNLRQQLHANTDQPTESVGAEKSPDYSKHVVAPRGGR